MVLTRSQRKSLPLCETETVPDDEFWAVDAAIRAAEEAFDAVPLLAPVLMPVVPGSTLAAPGLATRSAVAPVGWLPAPEPRLPPAFDARRVQHPMPTVLRSAAPSPQRRLSAPAALAATGTATPAAALTPAGRAQTALDTAQTPATCALRSSSPTATQSTMLRFLMPRRSASAPRAARAGAASANAAESCNGGDEALVLPDPQKAMRRSGSKRAKSGAGRTSRRSRPQGDKTQSGSAAQQVSFCSDARPRTARNWGASWRSIAPPGRSYMSCPNHPHGIMSTLWSGGGACCLQTAREGDASRHGSGAEGPRDVRAGDQSAQALARSISAPPRAAAEAKRAGPPVPDLEDAGLVLDRASLFRPRGLAVRRRSASGLSPPGPVRCHTSCCGRCHCRPLGLVRLKIC